MEIIQGICNCGELISIELNVDLKLCGCIDRKRLFYLDQNIELFKVGQFIYIQEGVIMFYCRKCGGYLFEMVFEVVWGLIDG